MSLNIIGGERESLGFSSEVYKKSIRHYLESMGYSQTTDSFIEGHHPDMVFYNREVAPGKEFWIESKATDISVTSEKFRKELMKYLISWLKLPAEQRFTLWIFAQQVSRLNRWKSLFENYDKEQIDDWITTNLSFLSDEEKTVIEKQKNQIYSFFTETKITIAPSSKLDIAAEEKKQTSMLSIGRKANLLLKESERRNKLIEEKNKLITNLLNFSYPKILIKHKTSCSLIEEIYQKFSGSQIPPFMFNGGYLYSFCDIEDLSVFEDILIGNPIFLNSSDFWKSNEQEFVKLLNLHIDKYARSRGLKKYSHNAYFFGLKPNENGEFYERRKISYTKNEIFVSKPMYDKIENARLNYVFHRAVTLYTKILWDQSYIILLPTRHFTSDGKTAIEGVNKDRLDRKFRNPKYNRSDSILRLTLFWKYLLFDQHFENPLFAKWFKNFTFGNLESFNVIGVPESINKNQSSIFDLFGGR